MDVTPLVPEGRQLVEGYGGGGFRIAGTRHEGSVLLFPEQTLPWEVVAPEDITLDTLRPVLDRAPAIEVLLIGCGARMALLPRTLRDGLKAEGVGVDPMDTGAACRTYNVLVAEDRRVAAALIAVETA